MARLVSQHGTVVQVRDDLAPRLQGFTAAGASSAPEPAKADKPATPAKRTRSRRK